MMDANVADDSVQYVAVYAHHSLDNVDHSCYLDGVAAAADDDDLEQWV